MKQISAATVIILCLLFAGLSVTVTENAYAKNPVLLRSVVPSPPGDYPLTYFNDEMAKRFNKRANGEYVMEIHAGGALAKLPEYFDAVRIGAVEMACAPWALYSFLDPRLGIIETPFLFETTQGASASAKFLLPLYDEILQEKFNAKGLNLYNPGGIHLYSTKPVKKLEDWKGLLAGAISPPVAALIKELGGAPVTIIWTDLYESLQKKVIDAACQGLHGARNFGLFEVCKYVTIFYGIAGWNGFSINLDVWKKMPKDIQQILQEETTIAGEWICDLNDYRLEAEDITKARDMGCDVYILPKDERDRWERKVAPYKQKQLESFGEFGKKVQRIVDEMNEVYPYESNAYN
ncbi:MAG: TRAP transporter substrate-binding protein DctP [Deltaproteobacteria bacterium]|nr:TRAP transporter substrate-binding protein DctP [Deltaproteobacteria bacterium]